VTKALRKLTAAEIPLAMAEEIGEPVLVAMRKLNARMLRILQAAEEAEDSATAQSRIDREIDRQSFAACAGRRTNAPAGQYRLRLYKAQAEKPIVPLLEAAEGKLN
jgi:hypothetical protein